MTLYKTFTSSDVVTNWEKLIKMTSSEVIELFDEWVETEKSNKGISNIMFQERTSKVEEAIAYMKSIGIDVYKYKKSGIIPTKNGYQAWFKTNVADKIALQYPSNNRTMPYAQMGSKEVDGVTLSNNQSPINIVDLHGRLVHQYNSKKSQVDKTDKLLVKAITYATLHEIDIDDLTPKQIIMVVDEQAKENYLKENVPVGTELHLKNECNECSSFTRGEHRCSCGNVRIQITVEGDLIDGYYHYTERV